MGIGSMVHHFGPSPEAVGGMGSVLRAYLDHQIGADEVFLHPTWIPDELSKQARLLISALRKIHGLPPAAVVHVHLSERGSFLREGCVLAYASAWGHPTVATIHGADFEAFAHSRPGLVARVLKAASAVTVLSSETQMLIEELLPDGLVVLVPNPVSIDEQCVPASETPPSVLFAGEISLRKGADTLVSAWPMVRERLPTATCLMVGPKGDFVATPQPGLMIEGPISQSEISDALRRCRVVALPSRAEAMPMILLEALGHGRPFVSTPVGGIPDLADAGGLLVPVDAPRELADGLLKFLTDASFAEKRGLGGRAWCLATSAPPAIDRRMRAIYGSL